MIPAPLGWAQVDNNAIWIQIDTDQTVSETTYSPPMPPGEPILDIGAPGFLLYNTHSVPIRAEDLSLVPAPSGPGEERWLISNPAQYPTGTLGVAYFSPEITDYVYMYEMFTSSVSEHVIQSQVSQFYSWSPTGGAWFSPLFTEDSRHVFYVTTTGAPPAPGASSPAAGLATASPARTAGVLIPSLSAQAGSTRHPAARSYLIGSRAPVTYNGRVIGENRGTTGSRATARRQGD